MFNNLIPASEALIKFKEYYAAIWPVLILIQVLGVATFFFLLKKPQGYNRAIALILTFLWLWDGIVHQCVMAAYPPEHCIPMAVLFILQGLLIFYHGVVKENLTFTYSHKSWSSRIGLFFMGYALVGYLVIGAILGHPFTEGGVFFSNICAFDCFTLGLLMMSGKKTPKYLVIIPLVWALAGGLTAAFAWRLWDDLALVAAGVIATTIIVFRKKEISSGENER